MKYVCKAQQWDASIDNVNINKKPLFEAILRSTEQGKGYLIYILILFCCSWAPLWGLYKCKTDYSFSTKPYKHNKESAAHTSIVIPIGIPVCSPPSPTIGDTIPAANMLAKPSMAEALPAILP